MALKTFSFSERFFLLFIFCCSSALHTKYFPSRNILLLFLCLHGPNIFPSFNAFLLFLLLYFILCSTNIFLLQTFTSFSFPVLFILWRTKIVSISSIQNFGFHNQQKVSLIPWQNCFDNTCMFQIFSEVKTILQQRSYFLAIWLCWLKHNTASSNSPVSVYYDLDPISQFWPDLIALDNFIFWYCRSKIMHCFPLSVCPSLTGGTS